MRTSWLIPAALALALAAGCSTAPAGGGPTRLDTAATAPVGLDPAPSRLTKAQFTGQLKAAGWGVGDEAYSTAVRMCVAKTSAENLRHVAELAKPEASAHMLDVYVDAVRHSC